MKRLIYILLIVHAVCIVHAQETTMVLDSTHKVLPNVLLADTIRGNVKEISPTISEACDTVIEETSIVPQTRDTLTQKQLDRLFWKPDPMRAVWLGAIVPGLGQIYNRSYWKVPIVYAGLMGCAYAITYTNNQYIGYKNAYRDIYYDNLKGNVSNDPSKSYIAILPEGYTIDRMGGLSSYQGRLKEWQNKTRRYRDLSIAISVLVYALTLVDAYVDAQLYDFDISDDLTLNVYPQLYYDLYNQRTAEVKLALTF